MKPPEHDAIILVKSVNLPGVPPHAIALDREGMLVRLSPLSFRHPNDAHQLKRWDTVHYEVAQAEASMLTLKPQSLVIVSELVQDERAALLEPLIAEAPGTADIVLLKPQDVQFFAARKTPKDIADEEKANPGSKPFSYRFRYKYRTEVGEQESPYLDPEMDATFSNLAKSFGEPMTVARVIQTYGKEMPKRGLLFVLSRAGKDWVICGLVGLHEVNALRSNLDLVV